MDVDDVLDDTIDPSDLKSFRDPYEMQRKNGAPTEAVTFSYAHGLIKSTKSDVRLGIQLLEEMLRTENDDISRRDLVYYLAIGNARLKDYDRAIAYLDVLLAAETHNHQAKELKDIIKKRMKRDGFLGAAIAGVGTMVVGGLVAALFAAARK